MLENKVKILLIEDYEADINLFREVLEEHGRNNCEIINIHDGKEALDYLLNKVKNENVPRPKIIVLDLNIPVINGKEVLKQIKICKEIRSIPVIILSSSSNQEEIKLCYELGANCYITKTLNLNEGLEKLKLLYDFWLKSVQLPGGG